MSEPSDVALGLPGLRSEKGERLAPLVRLQRLAALERDDLTVIVIYAVAAVLVSLAVPIAAQNLVNTVTFTALLQPLIVLTVLVFLGLLVAGIMSTIQQAIIERLQRRSFVRTAHDVAGRLLDADVASLRGRKAPDLRRGGRSRTSSVDASARPGSAWRRVAARSVKQPASCNRGKGHGP
jgi:ABC-type bacteriocin/lantibiotic exporter with double-glycine peptidase domain